MRCVEGETHTRQPGFTAIQHLSSEGKNYSVIKLKGSDQMDTHTHTCEWGAVLTQGEAADLGQLPPEHTLNQT